MIGDMLFRVTNIAEKVPAQDATATAPAVTGVDTITLRRVRNDPSGAMIIAPVGNEELREDVNQGHGITVGDLFDGAFSAHTS